MNIINIGTEVNTYKSAKCNCCGIKLVTGEKIAWVMKAQGRFFSTSNFHLLCLDKELKEVQTELDIMYQNLISVSEEIDMAKQLKCNAEVNKIV